MKTGTTLRLLRKVRGLSLAHLAQIVNRSEGHLHYIECGEREPGPLLARQLEGIFNCPIADLLTECEVRLETPGETSGALFLVRSTRGA